MTFPSRNISLRRSLTVLVIFGILNVFATPIFSAMRVHRGRVMATPVAPDEPAHFVRQISLKTNDLVYSATTGKLYASLPSAAGSGGNSIATIDPATGALTGSTFIGSEPNKLALSDDGHSLYAMLDGASAIRRFNVATQTAGPQFSIGENQFHDRYAVNDLAVAPGNPNLVAVARLHPGLSPPEAGVAVFDNGVQRPNTGPTHIEGSDFLAFSASASKLYGTGFNSGLKTMTIDASGVSVSSSTSLASGADIQFKSGKIFSSLGHVINPDAGSLLGTFPLSTSNPTQAFVPDTSVARAYYLTVDSFFGSNYTLKAFDINTFVLVGSISLPGLTSMPTSLVRWGANGLAFRTDDKLYIIQTSLIPSATPIPTPTPTPSPVPVASPSPAPAFVRQLPLTTNDLVYNQGTQKLYASVPSAEGSTGNSIAELDPASGVISKSVFVGSEPAQLAQSDDGHTLYVALEGASAVRSYDILSHTAGSQFPLGLDNFAGAYSAFDLAVAPGNPQRVAVSRHFQNFSGAAGVAVFENGVQGPNIGPGFGGSDLLVFGSSSTLYVAGFEGLTTMTVDASGVTGNGTVPFFSGANIRFENNLIYGSSGQVINPATGDLAGSFTGLGFGPILMTTDVANGRVYFLTSFPNVQLKAYDINTFLPLGFVNISGVSGTPGGLVRWGTNGLAFRTNNRQLFLIETSLVGAGPVPAATPTPSPTPSPSPAYIPTFVRRVDQQANGLVYSSSAAALYASVPGGAPSNGNSITKIVPATGQVGPSTFIGSEPNKLAISTDGQTIYAHLDGANSVRRFDVPTQTAGLQFQNSSQPPNDMEVVPGSPNSVALSRGSDGIAIYDNGVQRPNTGTGTFSSVGPLEFGASAATLYGYDFGNFALVKYQVNASGVTVLNSNNNLISNFSNLFEFSNGKIYSGGGRVVDPEAKKLIGTFAGIGFQSGMAVDVANNRVFFISNNNGSNAVLSAFNATTFLPVGSVTIPGITTNPVNLVRWGTNGLAFNTSPSFGTGPREVYLLQTALVSNTGTIPTGLQLDLNAYSLFEGFANQVVKVVRTGNVSGPTSVNYATVDGTAKADSDYTAVSGTLTFAPGELSKEITIPILNDNVFEPSETFTIALGSPTGGALLTNPTSSVITIVDFDQKPGVFATSLQNSEGNSGTKTFTFTVSLTNPSSQAITVDFDTSNGTATAGADYSSVSGTLTFPAGTTSKTVNVLVNGDTVVEPNETFLLELRNATNAGFTSSPATATIVNDDDTFQLTAASFNVNEQAGSAVVTVTRLGQLSTQAAVNYATSDAAGLASCTLVNGKASERCDYATTVGTLRFNVGETSKSFTIPIVNDALVEGGETFTVTLSSPAGALLGGTASAVATIVDNDTTPAAQNPIDGVEFFVTQQYIDFLGRLPDSIGLANWVSTLGGCPNGGFGEFDNPTCDRVHVSAGFFLSEEFRGRGYWAYRFYEVGFNRRPTYAEFVPDMARVGGPQSPESEQLSKASHTNAFVLRQEFVNRYAGFSNASYLNTLEVNAEIVISNKAQLLADLDGNVKTRAQVLREIVESPAVENKFFIRAFVAMQYFGYLRRDPDTIGYNNWVATLTANPSDYRHMIFGFIYSSEYRLRFGP